MTEEEFCLSDEIETRRILGEAAESILKPSDVRKAVLLLEKELANMTYSLDDRNDLILKQNILIVINKIFGDLK